MKNILIFAAMISLMSASASAQIAQGGIYSIEQSVIASGGGESGDASNTYKIEGTIGQSIAGASSGSGNYDVRSGFWTPPAFVTTAAGALVGGRVLTADGRGITNAVVTLSGGTLFSPRTVRTSAFGYFTFEDVEIGQLYILTIKTKKFNFPQSTQPIMLMDNVTEIVFQALPEN